MTATKLRLLLLIFIVQKSFGQVHLRVDPSRAYQTIENFGASDAWSCQFVGAWPDEARNKMADWLFSSDTTADGQPKGIGLSIWRFNIGAGSTEQGEGSGIRDAWRRAPLPEHQEAQVWWLKAAKQRGVPQYLAFLNSPAVSLTRNGKAFSGHAGVSNIDSGNYAAFARFMTGSLSTIQKAAGIRFDYISPVNEPQWDWSDGGQEGCPYANREIYGVVKALDASLRKSRMKTQILVTESGHIKYLLPANDKQGRNDQLETFFSKRSPYYIGELYNVKKVIATHSYFSTSPWEKGIDIRNTVASRVDSLGIGLWQSEYCILGDNEGVINGAKRDSAMEGALYMARVIHNDLVYAQVRAWQWWLAISPYNYKDGLIYVDKSATDGQYSDSRRLWALGNYSRFIRPGMRRVEADLDGSKESLHVSAYQDPETRRLIVVVINEGKTAQEISMTGKTVTTYTTAMGENLKKREFPADKVSIVPQSITTLVN